jgi:hypothetical protein
VETDAHGVRLLVPDWDTADIKAVAIAAGSFVAMFCFKAEMISTLGVSAAVGLVLHLLLAN